MWCCTIVILAHERKAQGSGVQSQPSAAEDVVHGQCSLELMSQNQNKARTFHCKSRQFYFFLSRKDVTLSLSIALACYYCTSYINMTLNKRVGRTLVFSILKRSTQSFIHNCINSRVSLFVCLSVFCTLSERQFLLTSSLPR